MDHIGYASLGFLRQQVADGTQQADNTAYTQFIKDRINWHYFDAWQRYDWRDLRRFHEGRHSHLTDADGDASYSQGTLEAFQSNGYEALPLDVGEVFSFVNGYAAGTMQTPPVLTKMDQAEFFEAISFDPDMTGVPEIWTLAGTTPLRRPIVVNEQLRLVSSSAADTAAVRIQGITSAAYLANNYGNDTAETVTLTGTTPVNSSQTYANGWSILSINVSTALAGTVSIGGATSGIVYVSLIPFAGITDGPVYKQRLLVRMWPCPTAGTPYSLFYKRKITKLINDQDTPLWSIGTYLVEKGIADVFERMRIPELAQNHHAKADQLLAHMIQNEETGVNHMSRPQTVRAYMQGMNIVRPGP